MTVHNRQYLGYDHILHLTPSPNHKYVIALMARFMGPTWGPPGADSTLVGPMLATWTLLSGIYQTVLLVNPNSYRHMIICTSIYVYFHVVIAAFYRAWFTFRICRISRKSYSNPTDITMIPSHEKSLYSKVRAHISRVVNTLFLCDCNVFSCMKCVIYSYAHPLVSLCHCYFSRIKVIYWA